MSSDQTQLKCGADFIWNIAEDRLRDVYVCGKYRDVILPFTVLRRLDDRYVIRHNVQTGGSGSAARSTVQHARCRPIRQGLD